MSENIAEEIARLTAENAMLRERRLQIESRMSPSDALSFEHDSQSLRAEAMAYLDCGCEPYSTILTLRRWNALGFRVRKGEHACLRSGKREQFALFCRHQVDRVGAEPVLNTFEDGDEIPGFKELAA